MDYIDNLEKEITTIYSSDKIEKGNELMIFALYHSFYNYVAYSLSDDSFADKCHRILKEELSKYCGNIKENNKLDYREFITGYLNILKDTILDDYAYCFLREIDSIIQELTWVDKINKKELSFDTKSKVVMIINNIINNTSIYYEDIFDESDNINNEYKNAIINHSMNYEIENYSLDDFINLLKVLTRNFTKEKIDNNEIKLNSILEGELKSIYNYFNENERVILIYTLVNIISDISAEGLERNDRLEELSEELGMSKEKTLIAINKFIRKWTKFIKRSNKLNDSCSKRRVLEKNYK